eukprot:COSAG06_NODE_2091_length_7610_cov_2.766343_2_plen_30_part_00
MMTPKADLPLMPLAGFSFMFSFDVRSDVD